MIPINRDPLGLGKPPQPELFWSDIPLDNVREYEILIQDFYNYDVKTVSKTNDIVRDYIVFNSILVKGFDDMFLNLNLVYRFYFPVVSFKRAIDKCAGYQNISVNNVVDVRLRFKRITRKKMLITLREYVNNIETDDMF